MFANHTFASAQGDAQPIVADFINHGRGKYRDLALTTKARCLIRLGRFQAAEAALGTYRGKLLEAAAPGHYERRLHFETLVELYEGLGDEDRAAEYRAKLRDE